MYFPMNFVTAPLIAVLFLLAILAIGRKEVHDGTVGANAIHPIEVMAFFITLAYIAISIDASGLIRYLAFKVLQKAGKHGRRLFFYLYVFFFSLATFIGNDPVVLSGTAFLAYMTRVSNNIKHPRAWIYTQFALSNIGSAVLVSSNPTNLVLAGAFGIKFIVYTANVIVPVVVTAILLFPLLLYFLYRDESLIPSSIQLHELSDEVKRRKPVNPNIPFANGDSKEDESQGEEKAKRLSIEEILNPFLDKCSACVGAFIMATTLITILALNASGKQGQAVPVYWITLPAAFLMFCWDVGSGWRHRDETRSIARKGREAIKRGQSTRLRAAEELRLESQVDETGKAAESQESSTCARSGLNGAQYTAPSDNYGDENGTVDTAVVDISLRVASGPGDSGSDGAANGCSPSQVPNVLHDGCAKTDLASINLSGTLSAREVGEKQPPPAERILCSLRQKHQPATLVSLFTDGHFWCQETFPTVTAVLGHLPYALVPFAFCMFVLVQALVTKGWVTVFAYGWSHWVDKTGTIGAVGGMGFLSVIMCNVSLCQCPYSA